MTSPGGAVKNMNSPEQPGQFVHPVLQSPLGDFRACLVAILLWVRGGRLGIVDLPDCLDVIEDTANELVALLGAIPGLAGPGGASDQPAQLPGATSP